MDAVLGFALDDEVELVDYTANLERLMQNFFHRENSTSECSHSVMRIPLNIKLLL